MYKILPKLILVCYLGICSQVNALTVDDYTNKLLKNHPYFLQLSLAEKAALVGEKVALTYTDWSMVGSLNNTNTDGDSLTSRTYNDLNVTSYKVSAKKTIAKTGANISLNHSWGRNNRDGVITGENVTSVDYSRPLLQNRNGLNNKLNADIATIEIAAQSLSRIEQTEGFISNKINRLINLALAQEKETIYHQQLAIASTQLELAENKLKYALIDQSDFLSEVDAKYRAEQQWLQSQSELTLLRQELAALVDIQESEMFLEFDLYQQHDIAQVDSETILPSLRVIQQIQIERQKLLRQKQSLENKLLPSINLNVGFSTEGNGNNYLDGFSNQGQSWRMGFDVSYPLGQNKSMLELVQSDISLAHLNARQREIAINTKQQINTLVLQINLLRKTMDINQSQVQVAEDKVLEEGLKFENARGQKSLLFSAQKALNLMKLSYAQTAANYQINVVEYRSVIDQLM